MGANGRSGGAEGKECCRWGSGLLGIAESCGWGLVGEPGLELDASGEDAIGE